MLRKRSPFNILARATKIQLGVYLPQMPSPQSLPLLICNSNLPRVVLSPLHVLSRLLL
eukprot:m.733 g.733  ORF g.733 m.733 type:complete len:58 (+) comp677_c0_seq1:80-253(+)